MQRLKQNNQGSQLTLAAEELVIARQTPRLVAGQLQQVRRRVERGGYIEQSIHDFGDPSTGWFWHWHGVVAQSGLEQVEIALANAFAENPVEVIPDDPNGTYRQIQFWAEDRPVAIYMEDVDGVPAKSSPAFELAWRQIIDLFPDASWIQGKGKP